MKKWMKIIFWVVIVTIMLLVVDLVFIFTLNKPLFAIKQDNGDSVNIVYSGLFYDTYICHEYSVPQIKLKGTKYACAYVGFTNEEERSYISTNLENVSISISDISLTGATIIIKDTNTNPYTYGQWYKIEKQVNGEWIEVKTIIDNYGFNEISYLPDKNNEVEFVIDWEKLYGKLTLGSYRILKLANDEIISIEFGIAATSDKKIEVVKREVVNLNRFDKYLEIDNRIFYLVANIEEIYYNDFDTKITLKDFITKSYQTLDDVIKHFTDEMNLIDTLKDGGTTIYKSDEYDITLIKCNTVSGNKNIYIGDYSMEFSSDSMCR